MIVSDYPVFKLRTLILVLVFAQGIHDVMCNSLLVSHRGKDLDNCGRWTMPCRSVRQAVKISNDGDNIYIDYGQGKPYMECENMTYSTCSIVLTKSVSFYGLNGTAEVQCRKICPLFKISSPNSITTRIEFVDLVISNSNVVAELIKARTELAFHNVLLKDNFYAIYSENSLECVIMIFNSSFEQNSDWGIRLKCFNLTAHIFSSTFKATPVFFQNYGDKLTRWKKTEILIRNTIFDGENIQKCVNLFGINPFTAIFNVTITDSVFKNHVAICRPKRQISTLHIYDYQPRNRHILYIFLSNLLIENNYNNWAVVSLTAGYVKYTLVQAVIRDSVFRNNTSSLWISSNYPSVRNAEFRTILVENNTFVDNFYHLLEPIGAAAMSLIAGKSRVSSCRFLDNKAGPNLYTPVVKILEKAYVTFFDCYFENRQTNTQAYQLFATGNYPLYFTGVNTFNLLALKEGQSVFIRVPVGMRTGVIIKKNFKILCPQGYKLNLQRQCDVKNNIYLCYYISVQCHQCPTKTYTLERGKLIFNESNDIQCQQCPRGGDCDSGLVTAKPNFWGYKSKNKVSFIQCPPGYCCESENCVTYDSCHGNRTGTLCGQCPEGMSESLLSTQCISNTECSINYFFILGTIAMLVLYLAFFLYHKEIMNFLRSSLFSKHFSLSTNRRNEQRNNFRTTSSSNGMIKIFFYYYQVCRLLRSSVSCSKKYQFINNFENIVSRVMNMVLVNVPSFNCPLKTLHAVPKAVILHSVGFCLLGLLCLLYLVSRLFLYLRRIKGGSDRRTALENVTMRTSVPENIGTKPTLSQRIASAFTYICLLMYASSAQLCLSLLHCVPTGERQVLFLDGNINCYQTFQYFLLAYMISSILPFCLVPVLGSYLLKLGRIGVKQFCAACIFPLPFCCFWMYLLLKNCRWRNQGTYYTMEQSNNVVTNEGTSNEGQSGNSEEITSTTERKKQLSTRSETGILRVLLGPFRDHQAFMCFPSSHIPWEGFLIFRRLVLIIVLTFVYDIQLRLFLALIMCSAILMFHMFVNPFQRKRDNVLESFSLVSHVILCGSTLIKALYYGEDYSSFSDSLPVLNVIENILIVAPLSIIMIVAILSLIVKLAFGLKLCLFLLPKKLRRTFSFLCS